MSDSSAASQPPAKSSAFLIRLSVVARVIIGVSFIYFGAVKAADPVTFLKLVRQFDVMHQPLLLNATAAWLPYLEILCGCLLLLGIAIRGSLITIGGLLIGFTALIAWRAVGIHGAEEIAFCAIRFDCGCGSGEVNACGKLAQNTGLILLTALTLVAPRYPLAFKSRLW